MAVPQFIELFSSGGGVESIDDPTAYKIVAVTEIQDEVVVRQFIESNLPTFYLGLTLADYDPKPLGNGLWNVTANYGTKKLSTLGEVVTSFDTTGGTRHITQSLQTISKHCVTGTAPDFQGAIGVDGDKVNGCEIPGPGTFKFQITKSWPVSSFSQANIVALAANTFKTNSDIFYDFAVGTLLFLGASGSIRGIKDWEVTYHFAFSENVTNMTIGAMTGIDKKGWEYVWTLYRKSEDQNTRVVRPYAAYVERVCEAAAFGTLGV